MLLHFCVHVGNPSRGELVGNAPHPSWLLLCSVLLSAPFANLSLLVLAALVLMATPDCAIQPSGIPKQDAPVLLFCICYARDAERSKKPARLPRPCENRRVHATMTTDYAFQQFCCSHSVSSRFSLSTAASSHRPAEPVTPDPFALLARPDESAPSACISCRQHANLAGYLHL